MPFLQIEVIHRIAIGNDAIQAMDWKVIDSEVVASQGAINRCTPVLGN